MPKEVLLYSPIYSFTASEFITTINEADTEDVTVRVNCDGGDVMYGWGMIAKFSELTGKKLVKNDGKAYSMAAFFFCYADDAEAIDTAEFIFHRAAYPSWIETNPDYFDEATQASLQRTNKALQKALEAKIDVKLFEEITGVSMKDLFNMDGRIEVTLTAAEAKKVGLINRVVKITPTKKAEIESHLLRAAARFIPVKAQTKENLKTNNTMTLEQLKSEHPNVYAQVHALGVTDGIAKEKDRVEACLTFIDIDATGVKAAIESGKDLTAKQMAEFTLKATTKTHIANVESDNAKTISTNESDKDKTEKEKAIEAFSKSVDAQLQLKK